MAQEATEQPVETSPEVAQEIAPVVVPDGWIVAEDGDNYQTIAERLDAKTPLATAEKLFNLNYANVIYPGKLLKVK